MKYRLTDDVVVKASLPRVWDFFSSAENLAKVTPPKMQFQITTPRPIAMKKETVIDYRIKIMGVPLHWRTLIIGWQPPVQFVDLQLKGPYTLWHHEHHFTPAEGGTRCRDRVIYQLPFGLVGRVTHALSVRRQLLDIFRFRRSAVARLLGEVQPIQPDIQIHRLY